eukprot:487894-Hanusia_phi.AAC.1
MDDRNSRTLLLTASVPATPGAASMRAWRLKGAAGRGGGERRSTVAGCCMRVRRRAGQGRKERSRGDRRAGVVGCHETFSDHQEAACFL